MGSTNTETGWPVLWMDFFDWWSARELGVTRALKARPFLCLKGKANSRSFQMCNFFLGEHDKKHTVGEAGEASTR